MEEENTVTHTTLGKSDFYFRPLLAARVITGPALWGPGKLRDFPGSFNHFPSFRESLPFIVFLKVGQRSVVLNSGNTEQALALPASYVKFPFKDASYYLAIATHFTLKGDSAKARSGRSSW